MIEFRTLKADEIDVKVGSVSKGYYTLLLYKNARVDMSILDETVGAENWQRDHKEIKGNLYCGVGIWSEEKKQWIWKWDCGVESAYGDKEKGEASDSFKRACVNATGVGRELYTAPNIYIDCETIEEKDKNGKSVYKIPSNQKKTFKVKEIAYNDKREIIKLVIVDNKGIQVYPKYDYKTKEDTQLKKDAGIEELSLCCKECGQTISEKVAKYSKEKFGKELCFDCQQKVGK